MSPGLIQNSKNRYIIIESSPIRAKTTFSIVKVGRMFPDLLEIPSSLEKIEYIRRIKNKL